MIKFFFRWAFRLLLLAVVLVIGLLLLKDTLIKSLAERQFRQQSGLQVRIGRMDVGLFTPTISIQNMVIYNSSEFGGSVFLDVPDLHAEYHGSAVPFQNFRLKLLRLNLREVSVVEDLQGRTNIIEFFSRVAPEALAKPRGPSAPDESSGGIDMLNLSVGKVRYMNLRHPRRNQEFNLNLQNEIIPNVRSENDLAGILLKVLLRTGITIYLDAPRSSVGRERRAP